LLLYNGRLYYIYYIIRCCFWIILLTSWCYSCHFIHSTPLFIIKIENLYYIILLNRIHVQNFAGVIKILSTPRVTFTLSFSHTYCRYFIESIQLFANLWNFKDKKRLQF
jgi:hypothetical protein